MCTLEMYSRWLSREQFSNVTLTAAYLVWIVATIVVEVTDSMEGDAEVIVALEVGDRANEGFWKILELNYPNTTLFRVKVNYNSFYHWL